MSTFTLRGLDLVGLGACEDGKRLFLREAGHRNVERLGERELDLVTCCTTLHLPPKGQLWTEDDWADRWVQLAQAGMCGVRRAVAQALSGQALDAAVKERLLSSLGTQP